DAIFSGCSPSRLSLRKIDSCVAVSGDKPCGYRIVWPCGAQKPHPGNFPPCRMEWDTPAAATVAGGVGDTMDDVGGRGGRQADGAVGGGKPMFATAPHRPPASAATAAVDWHTCAARPWRPPCLAGHPMPMNPRSR